jgi:predicted nucleic acid-binding protein
MDKTPKIYLLDTTIFIDYLRSKNKDLLSWINLSKSRSAIVGFSVITDVELWAGVKNTKDEKRHKELLAYFRRFPLTVTVAHRAGLIVDGKHASVPDAIIAATAEYAGADIVTANIDHFTSMPLNKIKVISQ